MIFSCKKNEVKSLSDGKLRIVFVSPEFIEPKTGLIPAGGLANYLHKITDILNKMENEIHVVVVGSVKKEINYNGIHLHFIKRRNIFGFKKYRNSANPSAMVVRDYLENFNKKYKIDIIQYASYLSLGQFPLSYIPACVRVSSYAKLHQEAAGYVNKAEADNEREMYKASKFIFGPSNKTNAFIKADLGLENEIKTIETPFVKYNKDEDFSVYNERLKGKDYMLFFGTLWALKGSEEIAEIIYDFLDAYKNMHFAFVGKQNKDKKNNSYPIDKIIKNSKEYKDRVIYIDSQQHSSLYPIIKNARAVILPSRYDNFPNTCIEAMSLGKVVLGCGDAGFDQIITDGETGFLCKAYNSASLLCGLNKIMSLSAGQLDDIGKKAVLRVMKLTPQKIAGEMLFYYNDIIKNWKIKND
ncbi:MAG: glycosyltransferase family 4 protein [Elusimicrobiota bacterium]|jgi:glycosyltransferase involved in cell wall biosynthesis|nr:glycosyltransferase family 4 protein [Elusimicrobiota bacterium]